MDEFYEGSVDAIEGPDQLNALPFYTQLVEEVQPESLDEIDKCPACGSAKKHTFREDPHGTFVWRKYFCRSVLDVEGLHPAPKCDKRVEKQKEKKKSKKIDL